VKDHGHPQFRSFVEQFFKTTLDSFGEGYPLHPGMDLEASDPETERLVKAFRWLWFPERMNCAETNEPIRISLHRVGKCGVGT